MQMVESRTVEYECLPFSSIPHTTPLFEDFLHHFDKVSRFYSRPPLMRDWWESEARSIRYPNERRQAVADILERQNRAFGAGKKTLENIERLRQGAPVVATGQQVGLFGGPLFSILKAITASTLAEESGSVPIFWLATEDHDLAEVNYTNLAAADHLKKIVVNPEHREDAPVGMIRFGDEITAAVHQVQALFEPSDAGEVLSSSYRKGENFGSAFAKFYATVLEEFGIVFLNPLDSELHAVARPLFRAALEQSGEINQGLLERNRELEAAGYHAQVNVTPSHTLCFALDDGIRKPIRYDGKTFLIGEQGLEQPELLQAIEQSPEKFSANVLLRPVLEDFLLPTLCYVGGPSEIAYFAQAETVYQKLAGRATPVVPRFFATLIEPRQAKLLERYSLGLPDIFIGPEKLRELVASRALPDSIMKSFDAAERHVEEGLSGIRAPLEQLDRTLLDAAENAGSKMRYQLQSLRDKAARAEARKNSELQHHADELSTLLYPNKELQEREVGAAYFLLKYGMGFVQQLKEKLKAGCPDHQVIRLETRI